MQERQHYDKAPITEALIHIRVSLPESVNVQRLVEVHRGEEETYPHRAEKIEGQWHVEVDPAAAVTTRQRHAHIGYMFRNAEETQVFQAGLDGFTFNRLAPYDTWESFCAEARRLWDAYRTVTNPVSLSTIALRYINRLDLPLPFRDFNEYLRLLPDIPKEIDKGLQGYLVQLQLPQEELNSMLVINEAIVPSLDPSVVSVLLDIELNRAENLPSDETNLWSLFEAFHVRKNEVFEACITDATRRLIR